MRCHDNQWACHLYCPLGNREERFVQPSGEQRGEYLLTPSGITLDLSTPRKPPASPVAGQQTSSWGDVVETILPSCLAESLCNGLVSAKWCMWRFIKHLLKPLPHTAVQPAWPNPVPTTSRWLHFLLRNSCSFLSTFGALFEGWWSHLMRTKWKHCHVIPLRVYL